MIIHSVEQNTDAWLDVRRGIPTASQASKILTSTGKLSTSKTGYMHELVAKHFDAHESWGGNKYTERGHELEPAAVEAYEFITGVTCAPVGFITTDDGLFGGSPDRLVGDDGGVQIKCCDGKEHVNMLLADKLPAKHVSQVFTELWVAERKWWDFFAWHPMLKPLLVRVTVDDPAYKEWIATWEVELPKFTKKLEAAKLAVA